MKHFSIKLVIAVSVLGVGCSRLQAVYNYKSDLYSQSRSYIGESDSTFTIFLLERDIPKQIEKIGFVKIFPLPSEGQPNTSLKYEARFNYAFDKDLEIRRLLKKECQLLGVNGAYRISEGTYLNGDIFNYMVFRFK